MAYLHSELDDIKLERDEARRQLEAIQGRRDAEMVRLP